MCDWLPFVSSSDEGVCASASDATPVLQCWNEECATVCCLLKKGMISLW